MTTFARRISRVARLVDALQAQPMAAAEWPLIDAQLTQLLQAMRIADETQTHAVCLALERQYCSSPYLLRTFETHESWYARIPAPAATLELFRQLRAADAEGA